MAGGLEQIFVGTGFFVFYGLMIREVGSDIVGVLSLVLILTTIASFGNVGFASALSHYVPVFEARQDRASTKVCVETTAVCTVLLYTTMLGAAFFPVQMMVQAQVGGVYAALAGELMIPVVVYAVFLGVGSGLSLALTALQRNDLRAGIALAGVATNLILLFVLVPRWGAVGGAWALAGQAGVTFAGTWTTLRRLLPGLPILPWRASLPMARRMFGLGASLQVQTVLASSVEPVARLLVAQFGPLAFVAYFSMASRFVLQMRTLVFACSQPLLATFSHLRDADPEEFESLYRRASLAVTFAGIAAMSATVGASNFVGELWIGQRQHEFILYTGILALGWTSNIMVLVSYFNSYSLGHMKWNLVGHLVFALGNVIFGVSLGWLFGAVGVVVGVAMALVVYALVLEMGNRALAPRIRNTLAQEHGLFAAVAATSALAAGGAYEWLRQSGVPSLPAGLGSGLVWLVLTVPGALTHPVGRRVFDFAARRFRQVGAKPSS